MIQVNIDKELVTKTELKLLAVLQDGLPHQVKELMDALQDPAATKDNLNSHISNLRKKLLQHCDIDIFNRMDGRRISYVLARVAVVRIEHE